MMRPRVASGFTLLELLVVVSILAVLAGGVVMVLEGTQEDAAGKVAQSEMMQIKEAILQFKQDTGFLPKQGPFALTTDTPPGQVAVPAQGSAWFHSPANFVQLYEEPVNGAGNPVMSWNLDTGRGWRGPYLTRHGEGLVDVGNGLNPDGSGSPTGGTAELPEVRGVADPFLAAPVVTVLGGTPVTLLEWRTTSGGTPHPRWGRPYFLFDLNNANARIVSMGPNQTYDGGSGDDLVLDLLK